ncbi:MAG: hypothetical protein KDA96_14080, partial [Planctomycetaceae bacterium]|nr:hypothetical protein [Planctomycetaceae bacterium]
MKSIAISAVCVLLLAANVATCLAQVLPKTARVNRACCLPGRYDYDFREFSAPVTAVTFSGIDETVRWTDPGGIARTKIVRSFALRERVLQIENCSVRNVAVTLDDQGRWSIDLLA